ncbi:hypothetical protein QFC19_005542 [Naganishia cerealis]|uniref:Uncharacterized protein n=1 Tax=Naganishia cerealis TaxID=610337 RepID=A0ACC2VLW6_9TREE|nr:hypothetical protein QFC19_005542 [Naganishia cerealis]
MTKQTTFISGGNRGIGFALVELFSKDPETKVITTSRFPESATKLQELANSKSNVHFVKLDIDSEDSIKTAAAEIAKLTSHIDIYVSNSAYMSLNPKVLKTPRDSWISHYTTNVLGAFQLFQELYPLVQKSDVKKVVFISSARGSIASDAPMAGSAYGQSKAALNYTVRDLAKELKPEGFTIVPIHPGVVTTEKGAEVGKQIVTLMPHMAKMFASIPTLTPPECAEALQKLINNLKPEDNGKFLNFDGLEIPW